MKPIVQKSYRDLFASDSKQRVVEVFLRFPSTEFSLSDLATESGVGKAQMGKIISELVKKDILTVQKLSSIWRIRANSEGEPFKRLKITYNLNFLFQSGIIEFLTNHYQNPKAIVVFGSFRRGEDQTGSDIDIAIEASGKGELITTRLKDLLPFEESIQRTIQLHIFTRTTINPHVFNNIANGIVLKGFLEVKL